MDNPDTLTSVDNLALVLRDRGKVRVWLNGLLGMWIILSHLSSVSREQARKIY